MLNSRHETADKIFLFAEKITYKIFTPIFYKLPITPNQITTLNFFINNLASVVLFSIGKYWANLVALAIIIWSEIWDWMDGAVARERKQSSKAGAFLDPAFDYLWQKLLMAGIAIGVYQKFGSFFWLIIGFLSILLLVFNDYFSDIFGKDFGFRFRGDYDEFIKKIDANKKISYFEKFICEILTFRNFIYIFFFTIRYPLFIAILFNKLEYFLLLVIFTCFIRCFSLFYVYFLFLQAQEQGKTRSVLLQALIERYNYWKQQSLL